ncbi:acid protease, partial [Obba rivulosa]
DSVYTIPILVGSSSPQNLSLQVDTGSSDLWLASAACGSSSCQQTGGNLYDPASATASQQTFTITYEEGSVSGPIVWDEVEVGGYTITQQALAAASQVNDEPLESSFVGVLGLALPPNSIIAESVPSSAGGTRTGAAFAANLLGLSGSSAPSSPFLSLALERPGSSAVPSILGVGRHPEELVPNPAAVQYDTLTADGQSMLFWKTSVRAITVYVGGQAHPIPLPRSVGGGMYPTAVLDSGVPVILATLQIANSIYGALGIGPGSDGNYYIPCTTPLNMTISLDSRSEIPLHPLDLTYPVSSGSCTGMIQPMPSASNSEASITDLVLGVPFLRNTYTVMAYAPPDSSGSFADSHVSTSTAGSNPRLGLLSLTNATLAMEEFDQVRVHNQPLSPSPNADTSTPPASKHMSIGLDILIGLLGLLALCFALFGARWAFGRRRRRRQTYAGAHMYSMDDVAKSQEVAYRLARRASDNDVDAATLVNLSPPGTGFDPAEDTLRTHRFDAYKRRMAAEERASDDTEFGFGARAQKILGAEYEEDEGAPTDAYAPLPPAEPETPMSATFPLRPPGVDAREGGSMHGRTLSEGVGMPLLARARSQDVADLGMPRSARAYDEFGAMVGEGSRSSMAGVGTPRRGGRVSGD